MRIALILPLFLPVSTAFGDVLLYAPNVGDEYKITKSYETSSETSGGSSGSSSGSTTIIERVIGVRADGLEIEYDFPKRTSDEARARTWQLPVRVFRPSIGPMQLLNRPELEARVEVWLQTFGMTREACGKWTFTWNAFRIDCDPASVIDMLNTFDLRAEHPDDGAPYDDAEAISPGKLKRKAAGRDRETFSVMLKVDPDVVRRAKAESDVIAGDLLNEPVTLEEALAKRAMEAVTGTITVTLDADLEGNVWQRTRVVEVETKLADGRHEISTAIETVERLPVPASSVAE